MRSFRLPALVSLLVASLGVVIAAQPAAGAGAGARPDRPLPPGVRVLRDLAYVPGGHDRQKLDLYLPEDGSGPWPVLLWVHGGGWAGGDKAGAGGAVAYVKRGYAVASLNYRLSGDALFPAQIEDCKAAVRWLRAQAAEHRLDASRFGAWGSSAGGHLVALLGTTGATREFDVGAQLEQSSAVQAVCDYYGPTDLLQMDAHALPGAGLRHDDARSPESRLVGGPIQESPLRERARRVNPITYLAPGAPPFLLVHGDQDPLVPHHQSELLFAALRQAGVPVRFHTIHGAGHGTGFGGRDVADLVAAFFDHHLLGRATGAETWPRAMTSSSAASAPPAGGQPGSPAAAPGGAKAGRDGEGRRPTWEQILARDDANRDGRVTRAEFSGPAALFARLDRNGDGVFTADEYAAAPVPR